MQIAETVQELDILCSYITTNTVVLDIVCIDSDKHASNNKISLIFFYFTESQQHWCLPVQHNESIVIKDSLIKIKESLKLSIHKKYVFDKKSVYQVLNEDYDFIDLNLLKYMNSGESYSDENDTNAHVFVKNNFRHTSNTNMCVPIYKHARKFMDRTSNITDINSEIESENGYKFVNNTMTKCFAKLETIGICVNDAFTDEFGEEQSKHIKNNLVFSQYNLLTSTGRPSNRFAGVNYAALNKNDNSRSCFVSRYGNDGMLVMMDYNAFHPRLIAHLVNFDMKSNINPYSYLAKYFFNKDTVNEEDIAVAKGYTFTQIYGGFDQKWLHIPYFAKIQEYVDHRWQFFTSNGYIETPKYKRKIKPCHIGDANPNKLFNYILQAFETEMAVDVLSDLLNELKNKKTQPILYTYDSILFDAHKEDKLNTIKRLKDIMEGGKFPVKVYAGNSYKDMKQISI